MDSSAPWLAKNVTQRRLARSQLLPDPSSTYPLCARYAGPIEPAAAAILAALPTRSDLACPTTIDGFPNDVLTKMEDHR